MTLVIDASALSEYLVASGRGTSVAAHLAADRQLHLPHLATVETVSVLRGLVRGGELSQKRAQGALADLADLPATRWASDSLLGRIWELRDDFSAYDATYIALSEALDATLLTCDTRLARAAEQAARCAVQVIS